MRWKGQAPRGAPEMVRPAAGGGGIAKAFGCGCCGPQMALWDQVAVHRGGAGLPPPGMHWKGGGGGTSPGRPAYARLLSP